MPPGFFKDKLKDKKCRNCGEKFVTKYSTTQIVCSPLCAIAYSKKQKEKAWRKEKKELKKQLQTKAEAEKTLQRNLNALIRQIDQNYDCISCGGSFRPQAGHYRSVGSHPELRFNPYNIHKQCLRCNTHGSGEPIKYIKGIRERYGDQLGEYVEFEMVRENKTLNLSRDEINEKNKIILSLKRNYDKILKGLDTLKQRDIINEKLGIYKQRDGGIDKKGYNENDEVSPKRR